MNTPEMAPHTAEMYKLGTSHEMSTNAAIVSVKTRIERRPPKCACIYVVKINLPSVKPPQYPEAT